MNCVQLIPIDDGLTDTDTIQDTKNQEPAENVHFAQSSEELNLLIGKETKKFSMEKLIPVEEIQVDPCGNGWDMKATKRQQSQQSACILFQIPKR